MKNIDQCVLFISRLKVRIIGVVYQYFTTVLNYYDGTSRKINQNSHGNSSERPMNRRKLANKSLHTDRQTRACFYLIWLHLLNSPSVFACG